MLRLPRWRHLRPNSRLDKRPKRPKTIRDTSNSCRNYTRRDFARVPGLLNLLYCAEIQDKAERNSQILG